MSAWTPSKPSHDVAEQRAGRYSLEWELTTPRCDVPSGQESCSQPGDCTRFRRRLRIWWPRCGTVSC